MADVKKATKNLDLHPSLKQYEPKPVKSKVDTTKPEFGFMPASRLLDQSDGRGETPSSKKVEERAKEEKEKKKSGGGFKMKRETEKQTNIKKFFTIPKKATTTASGSVSPSKSSKPKSENPEDGEKMVVTN